MMMMMMMMMVMMMSRPGVRSCSRARRQFRPHPYELVRPASRPKKERSHFPSRFSFGESQLLCWECSRASACVRSRGGRLGIGLPSSTWPALLLGLPTQTPRQETSSPGPHSGTGASKKPEACPIENAAAFSRLCVRVWGNGEIQLQCLNLTKHTQFSLGCEPKCSQTRSRHRVSACSGEKMFSHTAHAARIKGNLFTQPSSTE